MTYKSSLAGVNLGGGKMVVMADRATREIMLKVGDVVNHFNGNYITAEDVGTTLDDILIAREVTPHTITRDGSLLTARGVLSAMLTATLFQGQWGDSLDGVPIWVQGLGKVGMPLALLLSKLDSPNLYVSDLRPELVAQACAAGAYEIGETDKKFMAIYAPCALGPVINAGNVRSVPYTIVCGAANNQLADDSYAEILHQQGILYCPDWLVNAGGVIGAACEIGQEYDQTKAEEMTDDIGQTLFNVLRMAKAANTTPLQMALTLAEARL
jgi:leucine dehydrogenase